jgi:hypothetical protein
MGWVKAKCPRCWDPMPCGCEDEPKPMFSERCQKCWDRKPCQCDKEKQDAKNQRRNGT